MKEVFEILNIKIDTHVHTIASGHAYSVLSDYIRIAKQKNVEMFALTDHGPEMPGGPHIFHLGNQKEIPSIIENVEILKGAEANIINYKGEIDIPEFILKRLDIVLASLHTPCIESSTIEVNTQTLINTMRSGVVDVIGHSGNTLYPIDIDRFVRAAVENNVLIELNSGSFEGSRSKSWQNCIEIARKAKKYGAFITTGSDSHIHYRLCDFDKIYKIMEIVDFPEELIITTSKDKLKDFLKMRRSK